MHTGSYDKQYSSRHKNQCYNHCLYCYLYPWFWAAKFGYVCLPKSWFSRCLVTLWNSTHQSFDIWHISLQNWSNWHNYQILTLIFFNLAPIVSNLMRFEAWSFIKRFTTASSNLSKFNKMSLVDLKLESETAPKNGSKIRQTEDFKHFFLFSNFFLKSWFQRLE